jgi:hypothetical protein
MSQLSWNVFVAPELALAGDDLPPRLSTRTWGPVSATLIMGREDAVLVDALLTTAQATALAGWIQARGRNLIPVELGHTDTATTTCLHVPSLGLVVAADAVYNTTHAFTGESDARARRQWRAALDAIASLSPRTVIAGHKPPGADDSPRHIELTRRYLDDFDRLQAAAPGATALYEAMLSRYPAWASPRTLWRSIRAQAAST